MLEVNLNDPQTVSDLIKQAINAAVFESSFRALSEDMGIAHSTLSFFSREGVSLDQLERIMKLLDLAGLQIVKK